MKNFKRLLSSALAIAMVLSTFILIPALSTHVDAAQARITRSYVLDKTTFGQEGNPFKLFWAGSSNHIYSLDSDGKLEELSFSEEKNGYVHYTEGVESEPVVTLNGDNYLHANVYSPKGDGSDGQSVCVKFVAPTAATYTITLDAATQAVDFEWGNMRGAWDWNDDAKLNGGGTKSYTISLQAGDVQWFYIRASKGSDASSVIQVPFKMSASYVCETNYTLNSNHGGYNAPVGFPATTFGQYELFYGDALNVGGDVNSTVQNLKTPVVSGNKLVKEDGTTQVFYSTNGESPSDGELIGVANQSSIYVVFTAPVTGNYTYVYTKNVWNSWGGIDVGVYTDAAAYGAAPFLAAETLWAGVDGHVQTGSVRLNAGDKIYYFAGAGTHEEQAEYSNFSINIYTTLTDCAIEYTTTETNHSGTCSACGYVVDEAHVWENGACAVCGYPEPVVDPDPDEPDEPTECVHAYENGVCTLCGDECTHVGTWTEEGCTNCGVTEHTCVAAGAPVQGENFCTDTCKICGTDMVASHEGIVKCEQCGSEFSAYLAGLEGDATNIDIGDSFAVALRMGGVKTTYNSFKLVFTYDTTKLTFDQDASTLAKTLDVTNKTMEITVDNGTITITGYGADITADNSFKLVFDAIAATEEDTQTLVTLTYAAFSDKVMAEVEDLEPLTDEEITAETAGVEIRGTYNVTVEGENVTADADTVDHGEDVTFRVDDIHYNYDVTVMVNGEEVTPEYDEETGVFTVTDVTGDVEFTVNGRTAHTYNVTTTYDELAEEQRGETPDPGSTATHDTDFEFYIPADIDAIVEQDLVGYDFSVAVKINGVTYSVTPTDEGKVTIPGADIVGDIAIEVTASVIETTQVVVEVVAPNFEGTKVDPATPSNKEEDVTLVITPDDRFDYVVTATVSGTGAVEVTKTENDDGTVSYTVAGENVTGKVTINVATTLHVAEDNVAVNEYLTLDGTKMWLVKVTYAGDNAGVYTINGANMFFSEEYDAFCYLVIDEELTVGEAIAMVGLNKEGTATNVVYTGDVNMTGRVDLNDAQLTWNMYNEQYAEFTTRVTMEKFLRADVNASGAVDTADSVAIVDSIN